MLSCWAGGVKSQSIITSRGLRGSGDTDDGKTKRIGGLRSSRLSQESESSASSSRSTCFRPEDLLSVGICSQLSIQFTCIEQLSAFSRHSDIFDINRAKINYINLHIVSALPRS